MCSIIVAWPLNDRVRDGNVCCKPAIDTGKNMYKEEDDKGIKTTLNKVSWDSKRKNFIDAWFFIYPHYWHNGDREKGGQASRPISNGKLKTLLLLHFHPIKVVVYNRPSGDLRPGTSNLRGGLALRCFQRLSFPDIATQRCVFTHNWNTRGQSFPVLSY